MQWKIMSKQSQIELEAVQDINRIKSLKHWRIYTFILVFIYYSSATACRQGWSQASILIVKQKSNDYTDEELRKQYENIIGKSNLIFLSVYATGMVFGGKIGDLMRLNIYLFFGFFVSAVSYFAMCFLTYQDVGNFETVILCFMALSGLGQSVGLPGSVSTMGNWVDPSIRGIVLGLWAGCQNLGDILGLIVGGIFVNSYSPTHFVYWQKIFLYVAGFMFIMSIVVAFFLKPYPHEVGFTETEINNINEVNLEKRIQNQKLSSKQHSINEQFIKNEDTESNQSNNSGMGTITKMKNIDQEKERKQRSLNILTIFRIPKIAQYVGIMMCLKSLYYGFVYWLPTYIVSKGGKAADQQSYISSMMDVGSFFGGLIVGRISDQFQGKRAIVMLPCMIMSVILMCIVNFVLNGEALPYYFVIIGIGLTFGGSYNVCGTVVACDLSAQQEFQSSPESQSMVTGVINGMGAYSASLLQYILGIYTSQAFMIFISIGIICSILLIPMFIKNLKQFLQQKKSDQN